MNTQPVKCLFCGNRYVPYHSASRFCSFGCALRYEKGDIPEPLEISPVPLMELFPVHPSDRNIPTVGILNIPEGWQDANGFHYGKQPKPESR